MDEQQTRNIQTNENRRGSFEEMVQHYARCLADQHAQEEAERATPSSNQEREPAPHQAQISEEDQPPEDQGGEYSKYNPWEECGAENPDDPQQKCGHPAGHKGLHPWERRPAQHPHIGPRPKQ